MNQLGQAVADQHLPIGAALRLTVTAKQLATALAANTARAIRAAAEAWGVLRLE